MPSKKRPRSREPKQIKESPLSKAAIARADSSHAALHTTASLCEGDLLVRQGICTADASTHVVDAVSSLVGAVEQSVSKFVSSVRRHSLQVDKGLGMTEEELTDTMKTLESLMQQSFTGDASPEYTEDSAATIHHLLQHCIGFPSPSSLITSARSDALACVRSASHVDVGIDPVRSKVSHAPWLSRGECNAVTIDAYSATGEAVYGLGESPVDVHCAINPGSFGWFVVSVAVEGNVVSLDIVVAPECSEEAVVYLKGCTSSLIMTIPLKAAASAATEATALAVCQRVSTSTNNVWGSLHAEEVAELVSACTPALSSRTVAEDVLSTVEHICFRSYAGTRAVCGGAIDLVVAAMAAHGAASVNIAATGCSALWNLAYQTGSTANADVIVLSAGGVGAITAVMEVHAENERVQKAACRALWRITSDASPAARDRIQHGLAPKLIHTAMSNHSSSGYNTVKYWADLALTALTG